MTSSPRGLRSTRGFTLAEIMVALVIGMIVMTAVLGVMRLMSADSYDRLTGPLMPPADSGLVFHYLNAASAETTDSSQVARVEVVLRAQSYRRVRTGAGVAERRDSTAFAVSIRN